MEAEGRGAIARPSSGERPIRAAEVVGALSLATDLGTGQPLEHALRTAMLAGRLGETAGASAQELADSYYVALAADMDALASLFSTDITLLQPGLSMLSGRYEGRDAVFGFFAETGGTFRAELRDLYANDTQVVAVHKATATRGDDKLDADAALVFELADDVVTAITVHQKRQEEWDEFWARRELDGLCRRRGLSRVPVAMVKRELDADACDHGCGEQHGGGQWAEPAAEDGDGECQRGDAEPEPDVDVEPGA
jgi:ketosteroid isomerase-like protein